MTDLARRFLWRCVPDVKMVSNRVTLAVMLYAVKFASHEVEWRG